MTSPYRRESLRDAPESSEELPASHSRDASHVVGALRERESGPRIPIERAWHPVERVSGLVAHELKPPLSAMAINLDFAFGEIPADESFDAVRCALDDCRAAASCALRLVEDAMDAARIASGELSPVRGTIAGRTLLERATATYADEACGRRVSLYWESDDVPIIGDADLLRRVTESLIETALRMSRPETRVVVLAESGELEIQVVPLSLDDVFEGWGDVRNTDEELSVRRTFRLHFCDVVMRAHGGSVLVRLEPDGSVRFRVSSGPGGPASISP